LAAPSVGGFSFTPPFWAVGGALLVLFLLVLVVLVLRVERTLFRPITGILERVETRIDLATTKATSGILGGTAVIAGGLSAYFLFKAISLYRNRDKLTPEMLSRKTKSLLSALGATGMIAASKLTRDVTVDSAIEVITRIGQLSNSFNTVLNMADIIGDGAISLLPQMLQEEKDDGLRFKREPKDIIDLDDYRGSYVEMNDADWCHLVGLPYGTALNEFGIPLDTSAQQVCAAEAARQMSYFSKQGVTDLPPYVRAEAIYVNAQRLRRVPKLGCWARFKNWWWPPVAEPPVLTRFDIIMARAKKISSNRKVQGSFVTLAVLACLYALWVSKKRRVSSLPPPTPIDVEVKAVVSSLVDQVVFSGLASEGKKKKKSAKAKLVWKKAGYKYNPLTQYPDGRPMSDNIINTLKSWKSNDDIDSLDVPWAARAALHDLADSGAEPDFDPYYYEPNDQDDYPTLSDARRKFLKSDDAKNAVLERVSGGFGRQFDGYDSKSGRWDDSEDVLRERNVTVRDLGPEFKAAVLSTVKPYDDSEVKAKLASIASSVREYDDSHIRAQVVALHESNQRLVDSFKRLRDDLASTSSPAKPESMKAGHIPHVSPTLRFVTSKSSGTERFSNSFQVGDKIFVPQHIAGGCEKFQLSAKNWKTLPEYLSYDIVQGHFDLVCVKAHGDAMPMPKFRAPVRGEIVTFHYIVPQTKKKVISMGQIGDKVKITRSDDGKLQDLDVWEFSGTTEAGSCGGVYVAADGSWVGYHGVGTQKQSAKNLFYPFHSSSSSIGRIVCKGEVPCNRPHTLTFQPMQAPSSLNL